MSAPEKLCEAIAEAVEACIDANLGPEAFVILAREEWARVLRERAKSTDQRFQTFLNAAQTL